MLEVFGFSDGDVKHIIGSIKLKEQITVQCCDRDEGEDSSSEPKYPPATLVFHSSSIAAVKATLHVEYKQTSTLDDIKNAALRVKKLKGMENMIIGLRAVCFDPCSTQWCKFWGGLYAGT